MYTRFTVNVIEDGHIQPPIHAAARDSIDIILAESPNFEMKFGDRITFRLRKDKTIRERIGVWLLERFCSFEVVEWKSKSEDEMDRTMEELKS